MNVKFYALFFASTLPLLRSGGLPVTEMPDDNLLISFGQGLMAALDVPEGDESQFFSWWNYPTSIIVRTIPYRIDVTWLESGCKVYSTNDISHPLADVVVTRMSNGKNARLYGFGCIALGCSLPTESLVRRLSVEYLDPATNLLFVSRKRYDPNRVNFLISKNIIVGVRCATNALDFAVAILNAGLPENERIVIPPGE